MYQRRVGLALIVLATTILLIGCGDSTGPDQAEPGTSGPEFVTMTRDGNPWVPETSSFSMLGPGHASFGWDRYIAGTPYREGIAILLHNYTGVGDYVLSDPAADGYGAYGVSDTSTNTSTGVATTSAHPGRLRISGFDPADSTMAGNFRFDLYSYEGTRTSFAGSFRLRHP